MTLHLTNRLLLGKAQSFAGPVIETPSQPIEVQKPMSEDENESLGLKEPLDGSPPEGLMNRVLQAV